MSLLGATLVATTTVAWGLEGRVVSGLEELVRAGQRLGCRVPIHDLPGVTRIWIVEREAGTAHAAWCARQLDGELVYDLVIAARSQTHPWASCPNHVRLGLPRPFPDLRATLLPRDLPYAMMLSDFWYLRGDRYLVEQGPRVESVEVPTGPAIGFGHQDAGQILFCLRGRWIMGGYH